MGNGEVKEKKKGKGGLIALIVALCLVVAGVVAVILLFPGIQYRSAMSKAEGYLDEKKYEKAISEYKKAMAVKVSENAAEEQLFDAYLAWAKSQIKDEEYEDAIESCELALEIKKKNKKAKKVLAQAQAGLAEEYYEAGKEDKARKYAELALENDGENEDAQSIMQYLRYDGPQANQHQTEPGDGGSASGTGGGDSGSGTGGGNGSFGSSSGDAGKTPANEQITLRLWCNVTEGSSYRRAYEQAIEDMKVLYPNVTLEWEAFEYEAYKTKLRAAAAACELPDVFLSQAGCFMRDIVETGGVYALNDVYRKYESELPECMMQTSKFYGTYYGVPSYYGSVLMFVNLDVLQSVGYVEVPSTFDDFLACCAKLKEQGITPIGCSLNEIWCASEYLESMLVKTMGRDALNDVFLGDRSWNDQDIRDVVDTFQAMRDLGYFCDPTLYNDEVKAAFMNDEYAFYVNGTWNCHDFAMDDDTNYAVAEFPMIHEERSRQGEFIGGPAECLCVSSYSQHASLAAEYAFELAKAISKYDYQDGWDLSAWDQTGNYVNLNYLIAEAGEICGNASGFVLYGDTCMRPDETETYYILMSSVAFSNLSGEEFIASMASYLR